MMTKCHFSPNEVEAMNYGGKMGGQYLESIGKLDLSTISKDEFDVFIECVVQGYREYFIKLNSQDFNKNKLLEETIPF